MSFHIQVKVLLFCPAFANLFLWVRFLPPPLFNKFCLFCHNIKFMIAIFMVSSWTTLIVHFIGLLHYNSISQYIKVRLPFQKRRSGYFPPRLLNSSQVWDEQRQSRACSQSHSITFIIILLAGIIGEMKCLSQSSAGEKPTWLNFADLKEKLAWLNLFALGRNWLGKLTCWSLVVLSSIWETY